MRVNKGINIAPIAGIGLENNWFQGAVFETSESCFVEVLDEV